MWSSDCGPQAILGISRVCAMEIGEPSDGDQNMEVGGVMMTNVSIVLIKCFPNDNNS